MTTWFSSDHHWCHKNILRFCHRPFATIEEMDAKLIENWNRCVQPYDHIWHLGDFAFRQRASETAGIFAQLNGVKHLIRGNHDDKSVFALPWASQQDYKELKIDGTHLVLCHYAIVEWHRSRYGSLHLHGHHHGTLSPYSNRIDVGVDCFDFCPVSFEQLRSQMVGKKIDESTREDQ